MTESEQKSITLNADNKSTIVLMKNPIFHGCSKHINTRFHFICECVEKRQIVVEFQCTREQRAYIVTKVLPKVKFAEMRELLGVKNLEHSKLRNVGVTGSENLE